MNFENTLEFAKKLDNDDVLKGYRKEFIFPEYQGREIYYFTGNSLGLQPKKAKEYILEELEDWGKYGVEGHFEARRDWYGYHHYLVEKAANIVGAKPEEVAVMNSLTANLNLLMVSFYKPKGKRTKIIMEAAAFPSDHYAMQQQVKFHGLDPKEDIILLEPKGNSEILKTQDILDTIDQYKSELALVMLGGVNYYTGQLFDIKKITTKAHEVGAIAGYDLAHAAGNVVLNLNKWEVDFACWCSYKYLNSGPGGVASIFVHEKHGKNTELPRFGGWWGNDEQTRFEMKREFVPVQGASGWQQSNAPILPMAVHLASLELFEEVGMKALREKSEVMTSYLEFLLSTIPQIKIITPKAVSQRGCQLSLIATDKAKELFEFLTNQGIVADWREPDVIRVAPVPMYNRFEDCFYLADKISEFYKK